MGKFNLFKEYILISNETYQCQKCYTDLGASDEIISKTFQGRFGRAFLLQNVANVIKGPQEDRILATGVHTVSDIFCGCCQEYCGWFYVAAFEESQKYKEGKYILEKEKLLKQIMPA
eukprot:TRINITY_DN2362_c0_g1_i2.p1 TRINITY_DN2362_c0_g1~~TRINITY_DN2362_c0_g1_i2.p1  ORF type:complete len:117 (-),score=12.80 TRINITY_DN2362_c0_g1_i2:166-516(-)